MVKGLSRLEMFLASVLSRGIHKLSDDLPYIGPCAFFFGEPEYPSDEE